jgi:hypothetical protein
MPNPINIKYLRNHEINKALWDQCINKADNGLIYAYSFYLDAMASNWDALILNDYEAVFPLPYRTKWGLTYLFQPFAVAQLGLFGKGIEANILQLFLQNIPSTFKYWTLNLNAKNVFPNNAFPITMRRNYVLQLNHSYEKLYNVFSENIKRNIKKAHKHGCYVKLDIPIADVITLTKTYTPGVKRHLSELQDFNNLFNLLKEKGQAITLGTFTSDHKLVASCVFFLSTTRAYYILVGNHPDGRSLGASHLLINSFIEQFANQPILLDFEGSDIPGLALFYQGFGATEETYPYVKINNLPPLIKWLKK